MTRRSNKQEADRKHKGEEVGCPFHGVGAFRRSQRVVAGRYATRIARLSGRDTPEPRESLGIVHARIAWAASAQLVCREGSGRLFLGSVCSRRPEAPGGGCRRARSFETISTSQRRLGSESGRRHDWLEGTWRPGGSTSFAEWRTGRSSGATSATVVFWRSRKRR